MHCLMNGLHLVNMIINGRYSLNSRALEYKGMELL